MTGAYLPAFQGEASKAMIRIRDASATPFEEDTHGYPVKFFDQVRQNIEQRKEEGMTQGRHEGGGVHRGKGWAGNRMHT